MTALRLAHRGDWRRASENTVAALLAALEIPGCDGVEFDVRAAGDGTPVVLHDPTLDRVQGVSAAVDQLTAGELARYGVPTLAEALAALPATAFLDVELKDNPAPAALDVLAAARGPDLANAVVSSFEVATLRRVRGARPGWACWLNADDFSEATVVQARDLGCRGVSVRWQALDEAALARASAAGLEVAAWTVGDFATLERLERLGVTAVCVEGAALDG